jgi:hypothetical protein
MVGLDEIGRNTPALLCAMLLAVLFIQSGLDKVFDWSGNLGFLKEHFSKTFVSGMVPLMLAKITILELATGFLAAAGFFYFLATGSTMLIFLAGFLGALTLLGLFTGQRIAKDYPGAAVLIPYFLLTIVLIWLTNPHTHR